MKFFVSLALAFVSFLFPFMTSAASKSDIPANLSGKHTVILKTTMGDITLELNADTAPKTVTNFVTLAGRGYYDGVIFHRVIPGFMIQGGDPDGTGRGGESIFGSTFADELGKDLSMKRGTLAMANRGPDTNGSQFFILQADSYQGPYTQFGTVTKGMDVVDAISAVDRDGNDKPLKPVSFTATVAGAPKKLGDLRKEIVMKRKAAAKVRILKRSQK
ncbi:MAG: peptidyl-prolyl cis-trans isomerase, cyclophilin-type [Candidatus Peribacteria bacterium]|nr:peptidyl-prolyl cis-trans isomerase, cyclophilin-type [Candidatus Peribacteria bacterium]